MVAPVPFLQTLLINSSQCSDCSKGGEASLRCEVSVRGSQTLTGLCGAAGRVRCWSLAWMSTADLVGKKYCWITCCCRPKRRTPLHNSASSPGSHPSDTHACPTRSGEYSARRDPGILQADSSLPQRHIHHNRYIWQGSATRQEIDTVLYSAQIEDVRDHVEIR